MNIFYTLRAEKEDSSKKTDKKTTKFKKKFKKMNEFYFLTINEHKKNRNYPLIR